MSLMQIDRDHNRATTNAQIQYCLDRVNHLEMDQEAITRDFAEVQAHTRATTADVGWDDNFFDQRKGPAPGSILLVRHDPTKALPSLLILCVGF